MGKIFEIEPIFVDVMPEGVELQEGKLYISEKYKTAIHLCACGCKGKTVTPLINGEWSLVKTNNLVTLRPSIGNWSGENTYHAHYYITNNKIEWL